MIWKRNTATRRAAEPTRPVAHTLPCTRVMAVSGRVFRLLFSHL